MTVSRELDTVGDPSGQIVHEVVGRAERPVAENEIISFESASSAVHVQQSPQPAAFVSGVVFFSFADSPFRASMPVLRRGD